MKIKKFSAVIIMLILTLLIISGCGQSPKTQILGEWYEYSTEGEPVSAIDSPIFYCLNFYDDGTFDVGSKWTADWDIVNGNTLKFTWTFDSPYSGADTYKIVSLNNDELVIEADGHTATYLREDIDE